MASEMTTSIRIGMYAADLVRAHTSSHGIANYTVTLVGALTEQLRDETVVLYTNPETVNEFPSASEGLSRVLLPAPSSPYQRLSLDNYKIERIAASDELDILHYPRGFVARFPTGKHKRVATIHDDIPIQYAARRWGGSSLTWRYFASAIRNTLSSADQIITNSQFTRRQLNGWCKKWGISPPGMTVIYPGIAIEPRLTRAKGNYLLLFASTLPHKRTALGIELALGYLDRRRLDLEVRLIGEIPPGLVSDDRIVHAGQGLSTNEVHTQIAEAQCLVFPSAYEGFGLPPVEAFCMGTPAVFNHTEVAEEVMSDIPTMFEATDVLTFRKAMDIALALSTRDIAAFGSRLASRVSPSQAAINTLRLYHDVANI